MQYDNEITDEGNWTDQDICDLVENNDGGIEEYNSVEQKFIHKRYKEIQTKWFVIETMNYLKEIENPSEMEVYLLERARKLSGDKIQNYEIK